VPDGYADRVLLGLGRMSADSEIIALTALGIGRRGFLCFPSSSWRVRVAVVTLAMTALSWTLALRTFVSPAGRIDHPRRFLLATNARFHERSLFWFSTSRCHGPLHAMARRISGGDGLRGGSRVRWRRNAIHRRTETRGRWSSIYMAARTHEFSSRGADHYLLVLVSGFAGATGPSRFSGLAVPPAAPAQQSDRSGSRAFE